jgi:hypothetical protein
MPRIPSSFSKLVLFVGKSNLRETMDPTKQRAGLCTWREGLLRSYNVHVQFPRNKFTKSAQSFFTLEDEDCARRKGDWVAESLENVIKALLLNVQFAKSISHLFVSTREKLGTILVYKWLTIDKSRGDWRQELFLNYSYFLLMNDKKLLQFLHCIGRHTYLWLEVRIANPCRRIEKYWVANG